MTPRIKELGQESDLGWFSEELFSQLKQTKSSYLLNGQGPIFELLHPALIKCAHLFTHSPSELVFRSSSSGWNLMAFKTQQEALKKLKEMRSYGGFPWQMSQFIQDNPVEALINFGQLGSVHLTKAGIPVDYPENSGPHIFALPIWLDYALSPELWGTSGKWTRFHTRLHTLFANYGLLIEQDFPGFYPLKKDAQWLLHHGFKGQLTETSFDLIMTWDFPLSGLVKLETILARGR